MGGHQDSGVHDPVLLGPHQLFPSRIKIIINFFEEKIYKETACPESKGNRARFL
jgi:hypothetical protein